ncbi:PQQ-binding-like beta-propeller repeat protein [Tsukamurella sputi]|uniref:PQQ-binding-like beta-propeller repeat protein n=1 Tax=Tsukamurella sputi TaxID=2591848 RepID=A0A5C5RI96_9ACTN|nr:aryl-sulfate sulfotransferase [Tsukamurella sputi]TWS21835.1 PQQ-binding-like beta-propeller repeat protein [Tsukamurella sputi]
MEQNTLKRRGAGLIGRDAERSAGGYTLYAPLSGDGTVHLVDEEGTEVHRWNLPHRPGRHARLLADGSLAYNGNLVGSGEAPALFDMWRKYSGGSMARYDRDGNLLSEVVDPLQHHDAHHLDDGRILYAALEPLTGNRARAVRGGHPGTEAAGSDGTPTVYADTIKEVGPDGELLWSWNAFDHLDVRDFPLQPHYWREHWPLINSVQPLGDDAVVASLRSVSAVVVIDRATGGVRTVAGPETVAQQHHVTPLENGGLLVFDNGTFRHGESVTYSRVIEVDPADGSIVWQYADSPREAFFTPFMGGAQRLWNGNTLITEAAFGRLFEVTAEGRVVWEFVVPQFSAYPDPATREVFPAVGNAVFRAYRYPAEQVRAWGLA